MATPTENFGLVTVSAGYGAGDTSIVLTTGNGSRLPATTGGYTYPLTWWNATDYAHPADDPNREIVLVTSRATDTLTVTRAYEGTSATSKNAGGKTYRMSLGITKLMWQSLQTPKEFHQGLQLQTHRDSDLAVKQVELVDVEAIVMDDGVELRNDNGEWSGKVADITVSGAGGLDTGAEASGTWYEIYAIAKEDETRNLLLHKSKLWTVDTNYVPFDANLNQKLRGSASTNKHAQGFTLSNSGPCVYVEAVINRVGSPTGKVWFTIETNNAGKPSGTVVATSHAYDVARFAVAPNPITDATFTRFTMKSSNVLSASTQYHLVLQGDYTVDLNNCVTWQVDTTSPGYTGGTFNMYDSGTTLWSDFGYDAMFGVALETGDSAVSLPTGYTKKCFLGWVFNDGSNNFLPFVQVGRSRRTASITAAACRNLSMTGRAQLINWLTFLPPRHILKMLVGVDGTGTGGGVAAIGDLRAADISSTGDTVGAQLVLYSAVTAAIPSAFGEVLVQTVGTMVHGTHTANLWCIGFSWE